MLWQPVLITAKEIAKILLVSNLILCDLKNPVSVNSQIIAILKGSVWLNFSTLNLNGLLRRNFGEKA